MEHIQVKNNIQAIREIASFIEGLAEPYQLSMKEVFDLNLALEELVSNIVFYGYTDKEDHLIDIHVECALGQPIVLTIEDDATPFNPLEEDHSSELKKSAEDREVGGLGILFVRNVMDELKYERVGGKNRIILTKNRSSK